MGKREKINQGEARIGGDEPKNVRKPERVVGWLVALPSRFEFSATRPQRLRTLTPLLTLLLPLFLFFLNILLIT